MRKLYWSDHILKEKDWFAVFKFLFNFNFNIFKILKYTQVIVKIQIVLPKKFKIII